MWVSIRNGDRFYRYRNLDGDHWGVQAFVAVGSQRHRGMAAASRHSLPQVAQLLELFDRRVVEFDRLALWRVLLQSKLLEQFPFLVSKAGCRSRDEREGERLAPPKHAAAAWGLPSEDAQNLSMRPSWLSHHVRWAAP